MKRKSIITRVLLAAMLCALALGAMGCVKKVEPPDYEKLEEEGMNPIVTMELESGEKIVMELFPSKAPNTVANFITLINEGFYDGLTFHRAVEGFVIQGGCPDGTGTGGPGYNIAGEFAANGYTDNNISHTRGIVSMARSGNTSSGFDTVGSQFYICLSDNYTGSLDGYYPAFGIVTEGMEAVDAISLLENSGSPSNTIYEQPVIKQVTVETHGVEYTLTKK